MVKIDLITGFLGAGKTTFLKKYAEYLIAKGQNIGILENDFGAVNVDMMLLQDLMGDNCELEMVSGGCCVFSVYSFRTIYRYRFIFCLTCKFYNHDYTSNTDCQPNSPYCSFRPIFQYNLTP